MELVLILFGLLSCIEGVVGSAVVEVKFLVFVNPGGKGSNGHCCDGRWIMCIGSCDHFFKICMDRVGGSNNMQHCPYGSIRTSYIENKNNIKFGSRVGGIANPMKFTMNTWPGAVKLKVDVWDSDESVNTHDHVELLKINIKETADQSAETAKSHTYLLSDRTSLRVGVKVYCEEGYYGPACDTSCVPHNDSTGHYTCSPKDGSRVCLPGWNGTYCDNNNINECEQSSPCNSTHVCVDRPSGYACMCPFGKGGESCENTILTCNDNPCENGGKCTMLDDRINCTCAEGWDGLLCENKADLPTTGIPSSTSSSTSSLTSTPTSSSVTASSQAIISSVPSLMSSSSPLVTSSSSPVSSSTFSSTELSGTSVIDEGTAEPPSSFPSTTHIPSSTTVQDTTTESPAALLLLRGRLLGDDESAVRKGIAEVMRHIFNMHGDLILKLRYHVFAMKNGVILTKVMIRGEENGKSIDTVQLQDLLSNTSTEVLETYIPTPIYRESSRAPNALPLHDQHDSWIHYHWYVVLIGFVVFVAIVVVCVAFIVHKRRKTVRTGQKDVVARPSSTVSDGIPAQSFENSLYFEMNHPKPPKDQTLPKVSYNSMP